MEISKQNLLMLLCDAYTYHTSLVLDRNRKKYKNKKLKNRNDELIKYHDFKRYEINRLIQEIKENDNISIKNDYN